MEPIDAFDVVAEINILLTGIDPLFSNQFSVLSYNSASNSTPLHLVIPRSWLSHFACDANVHRNRTVIE
jgi:hypothetical protein